MFHFVKVVAVGTVVVVVAVIAAVVFCCCGGGVVEKSYDSFSIEGYTEK